MNGINKKEIFGDNGVFYICTVRYPEKISISSFTLQVSQGHQSLGLRAVSSGQWREESQPLRATQGEGLRTEGGPTRYTLLSPFCGHAQSCVSEGTPSPPPGQGWRGSQGGEFLGLGAASPILPRSEILTGLNLLQGEDTGC